MSGKEVTAKQVQGPEPPAQTEALPELAAPALDSTAARLARTPPGGGAPLKPTQVLALQRSLGNRATMSLLPPAIRPRLRAAQTPAEPTAGHARGDPAAPHTALEPVAGQSPVAADLWPRQEPEDQEDEREEPGQTERTGRERLPVRARPQAEVQRTAVARPAIQRRSARPRAAPKERQDVVVIVGRPSYTTEARESAKDKEEMAAWRAAGAALAPTVLEGLTADKAFAGLRKLRAPIGTLYIISHSGRGGIAEVMPDGSVRSTTVADLTRRIKAAVGRLGKRAPQKIDMLSCSAGGSPKMMGEIGGSLGAATVRAPIGFTVISGKTLRVGRETLTKALIRKRRLKDATLGSYIEKIDALEHYDFVPGVPHPQPAPSRADKLKHLVAVLRKTGMIPFVSYNAAPGDRNAVPYWQASVERRNATEEEKEPEGAADLVPRQGVVEVTVGP